MGVLSSSILSTALIAAAAHTGAAEPRTSVVNAPFGGTVEAVLVRVGDDVLAGQVLVRFRNTEFDTRMARVLTSLDHAPPELVARASALVGRIPLKTWHQIKTTDPGLLAAEQEYVDALRACERLPSLAAAKRLKQAIATRDSVQRHLGRIRPEVLELFCRHYLERADDLKWITRQRSTSDLKAPCSGRVEIIDLHPGDVVAPLGRVALLASR